MLILLPPSETKRDGGTGAPLDVESLRFPSLAPQRRQAIAAVGALAADPEASIRALRLGPSQHAEAIRNRGLDTSPTMPVLDRFTGVLYEGLDAGTLSPGERAFAHEHLVVQSALLGPIAALDAVPAYRLSQDSRLPGMPLKKHWSSAVARELDGVRGLVLDLRSEAYAALGPAPRRDESLYLRVLSEGDGGVRRALNHFNKKAKGEFTRAILQAGIPFATAHDLIAWAGTSGWRLERIDGAPGELALIV